MRGADGSDGRVEAERGLADPAPPATDRIVAPPFGRSRDGWYTAAQRRDSLYRRLLAAADLIAVAAAIVVATEAAGDASVTLAASPCR